jgi:hypothetical protein
VALFHARDRPPRALLDLLDRDERVLSWANTSTGSVVLATPLGLWWPSSDSPRRIGWQYINKAVWRERRLVVVEAELADDLLLVDRPPVSAELTTPRDLPPTVRKRVEANVVRSEVLASPGGQVRVVARRIPGQDGLRWWARLEPGTADTPDVREAVRARVDSMRAEWEEAARGV